MELRLAVALLVVCSVVTYQYHKTLQRFGSEEELKNSVPVRVESVPFKCSWNSSLGEELDRFRDEGHNSVKVFSHPDKFRPGAIILDIGSYDGVDIARFMTSFRTDVNIYTFEPVPSIFMRLKKNVAPFPNVQVNNYGISDKSSPICFATDGDATRSVAVNSPSCRERGETKDIALVVSDLGKVDLLHINCEGCEYEVLKRLLPLKEQQVQEIEFQYHVKNLGAEKYCEIEELLVKNGYTVGYRYQSVWEHWKKIRL